MPVMKPRRRDHPFQWAKPPPQIGVDEKSPDCPHEREQCRDGDAGLAGRMREAENKKWDKGAHPTERQVDGMDSAVDQEIDVPGAVVDRVEPPEQRYSVHQAVPPVIPDL